MRTKTKILVLSLTVACLGGSAIHLQAQPAPVQQFEENQRNRQQQENLLNNLTTSNAPELYPGENEDVGPQRILRVKPTVTHFEGMADTQYAYTDNNRLDNHFRVNTAYAINTVQLAYAPTPFDLGPGKFAPRVGFRSQWYNYDLSGASHNTENNLDFDAQTAFASGQYLWHDNWEFDGEFDYTRLLSQSRYKEFYSEAMPTLAVQRLFHIQDNFLVALSAQEAYHFSRVPSFGGSFSDVNDRLDTILGVTATYQVFGRLILQPYYRWDETYYPRNFADKKRNDFLNVVGMAATYYFTQQISLRVYASGSFRGSDDRSTPTYTKFDTGIGANLTVRF